MKNEKIIYIDKDTKEIFTEDKIRELCYNACLQDLDFNKKEIMEKGINIYTIFTNMKKSFCDNIDNLIEYANNDLGYSIEKWQKA